MIRLRDRETGAEAEWGREQRSGDADFIRQIAISYDDEAVRRRLAELRDRGGNPGSAAMREMAGHLLDNVNEAFAREASRAGEPWAPLKPATVRDRQRRRYGAGPILERSGDLASRILADSDGSSGVAGTNVVYAATHHFGDPRRGIPARPFLGVSDDVRRVILQAIVDHLGP